MKMFKRFILRFLALIAIIIITISIFILIGAIQEKLFLPKEYIMWIFKSPYSGLVIIYEIYLILGFLYRINKDDERKAVGSGTKKGLFKRHRKIVLATFIMFNIILLYTIISAVTVITNNKIVDYSFFSPQGREYSYNDIVKINTGVYGKGISFPFRHSKGEFFYIIEFNDGTKINLEDVGGTKHDVDERFIIEKLDKQFVNMGIPKVSSMENFEYSKKNLAKIYTDKIRNILENTN